MKKTALLLAALCVSQASADRDTESLNNIKKLSVNHICVVGVAIVNIDGTDDTKIESEVTNRLKKANIKAKNIFEDDFHFGCVASLFLQASAKKEKDGRYAYVVRYRLAPSEIAISHFIESGFIEPKKAISFENVSIWDVYSYGSAASADDLKTIILNTSEKSFADFLSDWRKTH